MSGAPRILVVEDSTMVRITVKRTLAAVEFEVEEARDGAEGLSKVQTAATPFDLILTDLNMPNLDGLSMVQAIRATPGYEQTPIVMLTTESGEEKKSVGHDAGISAWLVKPFEPDALVEMVGGMLF
ncbi:MAG: response regulator [Zetaproteobacteria bacterium CG06_land_8_20_14_3_00_59_53]|nr:MAG: response regulator [Zetaproteobacteria bacterium CG2_30_59_37]PIO90619.1 MAG: response regulator [Zetaproteobacteria bacterium CG23_combo_of_CG06-09_8_20_14_all_59_86]PIQ66117.1 MAG: response regulator [Zetaproteobacteria bacterium CG11_big_fil_rev_8_21_14_0_20_59_439]PIU71566.1 MAG: response regulator [Zetaproteobacteria bacterium CG06_land_8_20_14_3_00_59_53]PIU97826.1 MAG: response regulator [Zetaproteobacteria bacterium CG03_land_8_20_14_0_80_59_51]PIY45900.1 MAG: response regulato